MPAAVIAGELGGLSLPVQAPSSASAAFPDRALDVLAPYLAAFVTAYAGAAWKVIAPNEPIVRRFFTHDPEHYDFKSSDLPALYLFRTGSARDPLNAADDWRVHADTIQVFWLLPGLQQLGQAAKSRAISTVGKLIDTALEVGRDPSFVIADDPDPTAASEGSVVLRHAGLVSMEGKQWRVARVGIDRLQSAGFERGLDLFDGLDLKITIEERAQQLPGFDPDHPELGIFGGAEGTSPSRLEATFSVGGGQYSEAKYLDDYAMLYCQDGATAQVIGTTAGKLTAFAADGPASGLQPDHANDRITIQQAGRYTVGLTLSATGTAARTAEFRLRRNGSEVDGMQAFLTLGTTVGSTGFLGFVPCEAGDVLDIYVEADIDATSLTVKSAQLTVTT